MEDLRISRELLPHLFGHGIPLIEAILEPLPSDKLSGLFEEGSNDHPYDALMNSFSTEQEGDCKEARKALADYSVEDQGNDDHHSRLLVLLGRCRLILIRAGAEE